MMDADVSLQLVKFGPESFGVRAAINEDQCRVVVFDEFSNSV